MALAIQGLRHSATQRVAKRAIDVVVSLAALVVTAPVLAVCALAIRLHDGGPVLFRQVRVGRDGSTFRCLKLRTMADGERVTRVGRWLRAKGLDETPQFLNVLRGESLLNIPIRA